MAAASSTARQPQPSAMSAGLAAPDAIIFYHIGKVGGGSVRRAFWQQACRANATLTTLTKCQQASGRGDARFGEFLLTNSNRRGLIHAPGRTYEGCLACPALTPMAAALVCRSPPQSSRVVHMAHIRLGSELGWLAAAARTVVEQRAGHLRMPTTSPRTGYFGRAPRGSVSGTCGGATNGSSAFADLQQLNARWPRLDANFGPLYAATRPHVARTVLLREPFAHLTSMYHCERLTKRFACDNSSAIDVWASEDARGNRALRREGGGVLCETTVRLCGVDCEPRFWAGARMESLFAQTEHNLRHTFDVVGVLERLPRFYADIGRLHPALRNIQPPTKRAHEQPSTRAKIACEAHWTSAQNRARAQRESSIVAQLVRWHSVALERSGGPGGT